MDLRFRKNTETGSSAVLLTVIGAAVVIVSLFAFANNLRSGKKYEETTGVIVSIDEFRGADDQYEYSVRVNYGANGMFFKDAEYGAYSSSMKVGDSVTVLYNPEDPSDIKAPGYKSVPLATGAIGAAALCAGLVMKDKKKKNGRESD